MLQAINLDLIRQMTADAMRVFETVQLAQAQTQEGKYALEAADQLLNLASVALVPRDEDSDDSRADPAAANALMLKGYIGIQKAHAEFKEALYQLALAQIGRKEWEFARNTLHTLARIDGEYRDASKFITRIESLADATVALREGRFEHATDCLARIPHHVTDPDSNALLQDIAYQAALAAAPREEWNRLADALHQLRLACPSPGDMSRWLQDHPLPLTWYEIRPSQAGLQGFDQSYFLSWLGTDPTREFEVVQQQSNIAEVAFKGGPAHFNLVSPADGVICRFRLQPYFSMTVDQAIAIVLFKTTTGQDTAPSIITGANQETKMARSRHSAKADMERRSSINLSPENVGTL